MWLLVLCGRLCCFLGWWRAVWCVVWRVVWVRRAVWAQAAVLERPAWCCCMVG